MNFIRKLLASVEAMFIFYLAMGGFELLRVSPFGKQVFGTIGVISVFILAWVHVEFIVFE